MQAAAAAGRTVRQCRQEVQEAAATEAFKGTQMESLEPIHWAVAEAEQAAQLLRGLAAMAATVL